MPDIAQQRARAEAFRNMHRGRLLLLPNAWDVASARIFEDGGFAAIATTSAGIAFTLGYPDGERVSRQEMLTAVERIAAAVRVPVTADVEAGYGNRPEDAALTARAVIETGAVGMNLEDATGQPENPLLDLSLQIEKIKAVLEEARRTGAPIVLNARTDVYLLQVGAPERRYELALKRLAAFRDAGADCLFVPAFATLKRSGASSLICSIRSIFSPGRARLRYLSWRSWVWRESASALPQCAPPSACCAG